MHVIVDPFMLPRLQVDRGAIRFILSGANVMCPGLNSAGARMDTPVEEDKIVVSMECIQLELPSPPHHIVINTLIYIYIYM